MSPGLFSLYLSLLSLSHFSDVGPPIQTSLFSPSQPSSAFTSSDLLLHSILNYFTTHLCPAWPAVTNLAKHQLQLGACTQIAECTQLEKKIALLRRVAFHIVHSGPQSNKVTLSVLLGREVYPYNALDFTPCARVTCYKFSSVYAKLVIG